MFRSTTFATKKTDSFNNAHKIASSIKLQIGMTQFQENSLDCGVYVITFATDLCHGNDPSQVKI